MKNKYINTEENSNFKGILIMIYLGIGILYMLRDMFIHYGDDGILFWIFIRPLLSLIKGLFWILLIW